MKDWIWGRVDEKGKVRIPDGLPPRAYWYMRLATKYFDYEKLPWEMGYLHYEELDNIFPFIIREWRKKINEKIKQESEWEQTKRQNR